MAKGEVQTSDAFATAASLVTHFKKMVLSFRLSVRVCGLRNFFLNLSHTLSTEKRKSQCFDHCRLRTCVLRKSRVILNYSLESF